MSALRRLRATHQEIAFKPWIYEIAKNACIDEHRRRRRTREVSLDADEELINGRRALRSLAPTPAAAVEGRQRLDDLRGAFGGLSESHHKLLVMRELEGRSRMTRSGGGRACRARWSKAACSGPGASSPRNMTSSPAAGGASDVQAVIETGRALLGALAGDPRAAASGSPPRALPAMPRPRAPRRGRRVAAPAGHDRRQDRGPAPIRARDVAAAVRSRHQAGAREDRVTPGRDPVGPGRDHDARDDPRGLVARRRRDRGRGHRARRCRWRDRRCGCRSRPRPPHAWRRGAGVAPNGHGARGVGPLADGSGARVGGGAPCRCGLLDLVAAGACRWLQGTSLRAGIDQPRWTRRLGARLEPEGRHRVVGAGGTHSADPGKQAAKSIQAGQLDPAPGRLDRP